MPELINGFDASIKATGRRLVPLESTWPSTALDNRMPPRGAADCSRSDTTPNFRPKMGACYSACTRCDSRSWYGSRFTFRLESRPTFCAAPSAQSAAFSEELNAPWRKRLYPAAQIIASDPITGV